MGYFSDLDLRNKETYIDRSYHGFEEQLLWRYLRQHDTIPYKSRKVQTF